MAENTDWTPAIGWRNAIFRIVPCAAVAMVVSLGGAFLVTWLFGQLDQAAGGGMRYVPWPIWLTVSIAVGFIGGMAVSWKLVESTSLVGGPILALAAAALALAHFGTFKLGVAFMGRPWEQFLFFFAIVEGGAAIITAGWRILVDS